MKYQEIIERTRALAARPVRPLDPEKRARALEAFSGRTAGSARLFQQAGKVLPRGSEHAWAPSVPYPLFMDHGAGSRVWDVDGNEYLDYILAGGPLILGHNHKGLRKSMLDLIGKRTWFHGFYDEMEIKAAEKIIHHFPGIERVRFVCSGTEANAAAARIARSFTGKKKIAKYLAGYHGWSDQFMTDMEVPGSGRFVSMGVPDEILDLTVLVPPTISTRWTRRWRCTNPTAGWRRCSASPWGASPAWCLSRTASMPRQSRLPTGMAPCTCSTRW